MEDIQEKFIKIPLTVRNSPVLPNIVVVFVFMVLLVLGVQDDDCVRLEPESCNGVEVSLVEDFSRDVENWSAGKTRKSSLLGRSVEQ